MKNTSSVLLLLFTGCFDSQVSSDALITHTEDGQEVRIEVGDRTAQFESDDGRRAVFRKGF